MKTDSNTVQVISNIKKNCEKDGTHSNLGERLRDFKGMFNSCRSEVGFCFLGVIM